MLRKDMDELDERGQKGDWCFMGHQKYICLRYGDGGVAETVVLPIHKTGTEGKEPKDWEWNGSEDSPTLSPSILVHADKNSWHGFLREGNLIDA